jgi:hypothetical protein
MLNEKQRDFIKEICFWVACALILEKCGYPEGFWWSVLFVVIMIVPYYLVFPMKSAGWRSGTWKSDTDE